MKAQIAIILASTALLAGCATGSCSGGCGGSSCTNGCNYSSQSDCGQDHAGSCTCTDPNCGTNPCLSTQECCRAFGNVGYTYITR